VNNKSTVDPTGDQYIVFFQPYTCMYGKIYQCDS